jgi:hypothetical protein
MAEGALRPAQAQKIKAGLFPPPAYPFGERVPIWDERVVDGRFEAAFQNSINPSHRSKPSGVAK